MENLDNIVYRLVLNSMMREININFIKENIEVINLSDIPRKIKEKGNYTWFYEAYESECNYNLEKKKLEEEMRKSVFIMN